MPVETVPIRTVRNYSRELMGRGDLIRGVLGEDALKPHRAGPKRPERSRGAPEAARLRTLPRARGELELVDVSDAFVAFEDLLLSRDRLQFFAEVHLELRQEDYLLAHGLTPRRKFLFTGAPGTGKSITAEALADELGRQLATVNLATVVSSFLGDTAKNLSAIFDAAARENWVVLFDEFDAIGKERAERTDHGELKRVVTAFLQQLDRFSGPSVLVAATNHPSLLDLAVWRRFDEIIDFKPPTGREAAALIRLKLRSLPRAKNLNVNVVAKACHGLTQGEIDRVVTNAYRTHLLHNSSSQLTTGELLAAAQVAQRRTRIAANA